VFCVLLRQFVRLLCVQKNQMTDLDPKETSPTVAKRNVEKLSVADNVDSTTTTTTSTSKSSSKRKSKSDKPVRFCCVVLCCVVLFGFKNVLKSNSALQQRLL
jgi:hypothetical protein